MRDFTRIYKIILLLAKNLIEQETIEPQQVKLILENNLNFKGNVIMIEIKANQLPNKINMLEIYSKGYDLFKKIFILSLIPMFCVSLFDFLILTILKIDKFSNVESYILRTCLFLLSMFIEFSFIQYINSVYLKKTLDLETLLKKTGVRFFSAIIFTMIYLVIIGIGLLLFIIPGIYWLLNYYFSIYYLLLNDKKMDIFEAMSKSKGLFPKKGWGAETIILLNVSILIVPRIYFEYILFEDLNMWMTFICILLYTCMFMLILCIDIVLYNDLLMRKRQHNV